MSDLGNERERRGSPWRRHGWVVGVLGGGFLFGLSIGAALAHLRRQPADAGNEGRGVAGTAAPPPIAQRQPRIAARNGLMHLLPSAPTTEAGCNPAASEIAWRCPEALPSVVVVPRQVLERPWPKVRVVPVVRDGKPRGFMLLAASGTGPGQTRKPGGADPLAAFGLCDGDIIRGVAGMPLDSPDDALAAYAKVKNARAVEVRMERRGRQAMVRYLFSDADPPATDL